MLKGIDPVLSPELLKVLAEMGHGNGIALVDANFTATTLAAGKPLIRLPGISLQRASAAILSLFPLDLAGQPVAFMAVSDQPTDYRTDLQRAMISLCIARGGMAEQQCRAVERFAFYDVVREAYAIVQTGELQPYANFLFRKGVLSPADFGAS